MAKKIIVSNIEIEVQRKKIKNMYLSVLPPNGKVRISAPVNVKDEAIKLFATAKVGWIKNRSKKLETNHGKPN